MPWRRLGTATTQEHLSKIFRLTSEVVFCFDGDRAGRQAAWRALENSLPLARDGRELKFMFLPEGHDPDTLVAEEGPKAFENRLNGALPLSEYLIQQLMAEVDLEHVDGRAKLKALAAPLFARMPEGIYREMLADGLAARVSMPAAALKKAFATADSEAAAGTARRTLREAGTRRPTPRSNQRRARQFADSGHHPGAASPLRGGGGEGPRGARRRR